MKNKMTIYFDSENSKDSHDIYMYLVDLLENEVLHKGIITKLSTQLTINCN